MEPELVKTVLVGIAGVFAGGGFWAWLASRHRPEIDRETAVVASAKDTGELALAIAQRADAMSLRHETRIAALESRLQTWVEWGADLVRRWPHYRLQETPPTLPE